MIDIGPIFIGEFIILQNVLLSHVDIFYFFFIQPYALLARI